MGDIHSYPWDVLFHTHKYGHVLTRIGAFGSVVFGFRTQTSLSDGSTERYQFCLKMRIPAVLLEMKYGAGC